MIGLELSSPNFNSLVRAEQLFAIRYPNVAIKPLCGNLDICLNYYCFFGSRCLVALLHNLTDFAIEIHFSREKPEHANTPIVSLHGSRYHATKMLGRGSGSVNSTLDLHVELKVPGLILGLGTTLYLLPRWIWISSLQKETTHRVTAKRPPIE